MTPFKSVFRFPYLKKHPLMKKPVIASKSFSALLRQEDNGFVALFLAKSTRRRTIERVLAFLFSFTPTRWLRGGLEVQYLNSDISIHAPHTRCDLFFSAEIFRNIISIHAPHTRCDRAKKQQAIDTSNFNPRTSYEVRRRLGK